MFANIRIFSIIIALIVLIFSAIGASYIKNYAITHYVSVPLTQLSFEIKDSYVKNVWNRYYLVINYIQTLPLIEWQSVPQYHSFIDSSKDYLLTKNMLKVRIFNTGQQLIFDSNELIGKESVNSDNILNFAENFKSNDVVTDVTNLNIFQNNKNVQKKVLRVFIPITVTNLSDKEKDIKSNGILEFTYDIDDMYSKLTLFQFLITLLLALILCPIVGLLVFASKKVEELIEKQQEASTELANAKGVAESESKAKSQFLANVSHELRTPLNAIIGFSEIINSESMGPLNNEQYKEFVRDINASGVHLLSLINDILDYSKAEENKLQVEFEQIDLTKIIKISLRMVLPRAETAKVKLVDEVPAEHIVIVGDAKRIKQIVLNLLSNSVKFTPEGGEVSIKIWKNIDNNSVVMQIKDNGVGMAAQDLARALSPFGQVENKLSKRFEGTGLGLPLTKKLVEIMRGKFEIQSEPNLGTTITISFPYQGNEIEVPESELKAEPKI